MMPAYFLDFLSFLDIPFCVTRNIVDRLENIFFTLFCCHYFLVGPPVPTTVTTYGRSVVYPHTGSRVVLCNFEELCESVCHDTFLRYCSAPLP